MKQLSVYNVAWLLAIFCLLGPVNAWAGPENFIIPFECDGKASGSGQENPSDILPPQVSAYYFDKSNKIHFLNTAIIPTKLKYWAVNIYIPEILINEYKGKFIIDAAYTALLNTYTEATAPSPGARSFYLPIASAPKGAELLPTVSVTITDTDGKTPLPGAIVQFHSSLITLANAQTDDTTQSLTEIADINGKITLQCMIFLDGANWVTVYDKDQEYLYDAPLVLTQGTNLLRTPLIKKRGDE